MIAWNIFKRLRRTVGPADGCGQRFRGSAQAEEELLGMLREKAGTRLNVFRLAEVAGVYGDACADCVAIAFGTAQTEADGIAEVRHCVLQYPELRTGTIFQNDFKAAVVVQIGQSEGAAVVEKIEAGNPGEIGERSIGVVCVENVSFEAVPGVVGAD